MTPEQRIRYTLQGAVNRLHRLAERSDWLARQTRPATLEDQEDEERRRRSDWREPRR